MFITVMFYLLTNMILSAPGLNKHVSGMQKTTAVFVIGSLLHLFWWAFLTSGRFSDVVSSQFVLETYKKWFMWLLGIDIISIVAMQRAGAGSKTETTTVSKAPEDASKAKSSADVPRVQEKVTGNNKANDDDVYQDKFSVNHVSRKELLEIGADDQNGAYPPPEASIASGRETAGPAGTT